MQYTDAHLNYWGDIYCHARLWEYDLPFAVFVRNPWKYLTKFGVNAPEMPTIGRGREPPVAGGQSPGRMPGALAGPARIYSMAEARARRDDGSPCREVSMSIDGPDLDLQALTELYTASDLPLRGVTFEQFTIDAGCYLEDKFGRATLRPVAQADRGATEDDPNGQRLRAQAAVVVDLQAIRERRQAKLDGPGRSGEDDRGLDFWIEE